MAAITSAIEADYINLLHIEPPKSEGLPAPEVNNDGALKRQRNYFTTRFGDGEGQAPVEPGRYFILGSLGCGWARREHIILRLLGLSEAVPFYLLTGKDSDGWLIATGDNDIRERFGYDHLNDFYRATDPNFPGRGTSPTVIDSHTGKVVSNDYHVLPHDWEVAWKAFHAPDAPDLYPEDLRIDIDLLNQQLFDDVNNGTYKVIFAQSRRAAQAAFEVFYARLGDYDFRLSTRRYLFGASLSDSDVRLFQTLSTFERFYRPALAAVFGEEATKPLPAFEHLWGYARDLFQQGLASEKEQYFLGLLPGPSGNYLPNNGFTPKGYPLRPHAESLADWLAPHDRAALTGSSESSGPGGAGSREHWQYI
ncbi:MAG: glutathione S-transferase [Propionibacteriaceae bacterium]|jgi:putative glutathione S-transferase|nr:glutathione S-transferase [Propionibacteriaceae bacterium]